MRHVLCFILKLRFVRLDELLKNEMKKGFVKNCSKKYKNNNSLKRR